VTSWCDERALSFLFRRLAAPDSKQGLVLHRTFPIRGDVMSLKLSSPQVDELRGASTGQSDSAGKPKAKSSPGGRKLKRLGWNLLPPLTFVAIIAFWAGVVRFFEIPAYILPGPGLVFSRLIEEAPQLWHNSLVTITEILWGFGLTILTAIPLGLVIALSPVAK